MSVLTLAQLSDEGVMQVSDKPMPGSESGSDEAGLAGEPARWYLLQTKAGQELRAEQNLHNQNYHCFCPRMQVETIRQGRREMRSEVMFPGYLFVRLKKEGENWAPLRSTRGVLRVVSFDGTPAPIPDEVVDSLHHRDVGDTVAAPPALLPGDNLRITAGPFAELQAVFECFDGQERVVILLKLLQREHRLKLSLRDVAKDR